MRVLGDVLGVYNVRCCVLENLFGDVVCDALSDGTKVRITDCAICVMAVLSATGLAPGQECPSQAMTS